MVYQNKPPATPPVTEVSGKAKDSDYINAKEVKEKGGQLIDFVLSEFLKKDPKMNPSLETESFVKVWSLTGGTAAKLEINNIPSKKHQEFLRLCLVRALEELKEIEENKPKD